INTPISLIGSSMDSTVIDGRGLGDYTVTFKANGSIENFSINGNGEGTTNTEIIWAAIQFTNIEVKNCQLSEATGGISCISSTLLADNLLIKNIRPGFSLFSGDTGNFYISNCV